MMICFFNYELMSLILSSCQELSRSCQEAVKELSRSCQRAVGPALRENPSSTEVESCQSTPQGVSTDPCQADTKKFRPALLAVQGVFTLWLTFSELADI